MSELLANLESDVREKMESRITALTDGLKKIRTGKAHVSMLDGIKIDYYGSPTPLAQAANVTCPDAKSFLITPWEASILKEIETSIVRSDIGMTPINDGKVIRLKLPELTEERRKELTKSVKKVVEDSRISIRQIRKDANDSIKTALKEKTISEDDSKAKQEQVQKLTDDFIKKVDHLGEEKEKDLLTI